MLKIEYVFDFRFVQEDVVTSTGNLIARANVTSIQYTQSGVITCGNAGQTAMKSINVTVKCGKLYVTLTNY